MCCLESHASVEILPKYLATLVHQYAEDVVEVGSQCVYFSWGGSSTGAVEPFKG